VPFGVQFDGLVGNWNDAAIGGGAVHLFWRNPSRALIGVYASRLHWSGLDGVNASRAGVEGELYWNKYLLDGFVGGEFGDIESRFSSRLRLNWYATGDLKLSIGAQYLGGRTALVLGGEWQLPQRLSRMALFAEGRVSDSDHTAVWGGLRFYFGNAKSLIRRHREDDPANDLTEETGLFAGLSDGVTAAGTNDTSSSPPPFQPPPFFVN
jgi:hypothetical protein